MKIGFIALIFFALSACSTSKKPVAAASTPAPAAQTPGMGVSTTPLPINDDSNPVVIVPASPSPTATVTVPAQTIQQPPVVVAPTINPVAPTLPPPTTTLPPITTTNNTTTPPSAPPPTGLQQTPAPIVTGPVALNALNLELIDNVGVKSNIADLFKTHSLLFVNISAVNCNSCVPPSRHILKKALIGNTKCATLTLLVEGTQQGWSRVMGETTAIAGTMTPATAQTADAIAAALGVSLPANLPIGLLIRKDADGSFTKVEDTGKNSLTPAYFEHIKSACSG